MENAPERHLSEPSRATLDIVRVRSHGARWQVSPDFAPILAQILESPGVIIKESRPKVVARHCPDGKCYFIKRYRHESVALRPLKFFFKHSQARDEWQLAAELARRNIPVVRHVALGERWSARGLLESILITEAFDGVPANEIGTVDSQSIIAFVQKLAEARAMHTDFHPANILINERRGEIRLVDLDGIKIRDDARVDDLNEDMLAQLCISMPLAVSERTEELSLRKRKHALAARARRCLKTNRDFAIQKHGTHRWHVRLDAITPALTTAMAAPDRFVSHGRMLKNGRSSTVAASKGLVMKRFNFRRWLRPFKDLFRESRARQAFQKAYHLELCGISTARPMAAADDRFCGLVTRGFFVTAEILNSVDIISWNGEPRLIARRVGELIGRLHHEGFSHRDLKETNILVDPSGAPCLVDLDGVKFQENVERKIALENLMRLRRGVEPNGRLSRSVLISFLHAYFRARRISPREFIARDS